MRWAVVAVHSPVEDDFGALHSLAVDFDLYTLVHFVDGDDDVRELDVYSRFVHFGCDEVDFSDWHDAVRYLVFAGLCSADIVRLVNCTEDWLARHWEELLASK